MQKYLNEAARKGKSRKHRLSSYHFIGRPAQQATSTVDVRSLVSVQVVKNLEARLFAEIVLSDCGTFIRMLTEKRL